jgi:hypothetical protein
LLGQPFCGDDEGAITQKVKENCEKNEIEVQDMDKKINVRGTSRRRKQKVTNMH